jgi:hypothetical protein
MLRHTIATLAYRAAKVLRGAPAEFGEYRASDTSRTAVQILAHMGDLFDWALALAEGRQVWREAAPMSWDAEVNRFFEVLSRFDEFVSSGSPVFAEDRLFQGPIADALTHVGQLAMLRRMAGWPVRGENYYKADITVGRVGREQSAPAREFD